MKNISLIALGLMVATVLAGEARGHGFSAPPAFNPGNYGTAGGNPAGVTPSNPNGGSSGPARPGTFTPGPGSRDPGGTTPGGRPVPPSGPGGYSPRLRERRDGIGDNTTDPAPERPAEAAALGTAFKTAMLGDAKALKDRAVMLDVACLDAALRKVEFRVRVTELRGADLKRRIDVQVKDGADYVTRDIYFIQETAGATRIDQWSKDGGTRKVAARLGEIRLLGTAVQLADVIPFDPAGFTFSFVRANEVDFIPHETYTLKPAGDAGIMGNVTFRTDLRVPTHAEWTRGGVRTRGFDFTGWRFASGIVTASRVSVLGASLEPVATIDVREARINTGLKADAFDPTKAPAAEVVSGAR